MKKVMLLVLVFMLSIAAVACSGGSTYSFTISKTELQLVVGATDVLSVTTDAEEVTVTWSSSDDGVARVTDFGGVTAVGKGNAVITAETELDGKTYSASCSVTVVETYSETFEPVSLYPNDELDISLKGTDTIEQFEYSVSVTKDGELVENVLTGNIFSARETGEYLVAYSVSGKGIVESTFTRQITVLAPQEYGLITAFDDASSVNVWASMANEVVAAPAGEPNGESSALLLRYSDTEQHLRATIPYNLLQWQDAWQGSDYFELTYYIDNPEVGFPYEHLGYVDIMYASNDGSNNTIAKRFTGSYFTVNQWDTLRVYVKDFDAFAADNAELYLRVHFGNENIGGNYIDGVYLSRFRFVPGSITATPGDTVDVNLPHVSEYSYKITSVSGSEVASGVSSDTVLSVQLDAGEYTVQYTLNSNSIADKTFERALRVVADGSFDINEEYVFSYCQGENGVRPLPSIETVVLDDNLLPEGAAEGSTALKITNNGSVWNFGDMGGSLPVGKSNIEVKFLGIDLAQIVADNAYADKYLEFVVRYDNPNIPDGVTTVWNEFYILDGARCYMSLDKGGIDATMVKANEWTRIRIPVSVLKEKVTALTEAKTGIAALDSVYLGLHFDKINNDPRYSIYVYEAKITGADEFAVETIADKEVYANEFVDISLNRSELQFSYTVAVEQDGTDVTDTVVTEQTGGTFLFSSQEAGVYTVKYTLSAFGYADKEISFRITVLATQVYSKIFEDVTWYIGQPFELSLTEPEIDNFRYTVKVMLDGEEQTDVIDAGNVFTATKVGTYTVEYTVNGTGYKESVVSRAIIVEEQKELGLIYDLNSVSQQGSWSNNGIQGMTADIPDGAPGSKSEVLRVGYAGNTIVFFANSWSDRSAYDLASELDALDDNDYFALRYYISVPSQTLPLLRLCYVDLVNNFSSGNDVNVKRWNGVMMRVNEWAELRIYVRDFRNVVGDGPVYLRLHFNNIAPAPEYMYFYDFRIVTGEKYVAPDAEFSAALFAANSGITQYAYKVYNDRNTVVASGTQDSVTVNGLTEGNYTIVYEFNDPAYKSLTRNVIVAQEKPEMTIEDEGYITAMSRGNTANKQTVSLNTTLLTSALPQTGLPTGVTQAVRIEGNKELTAADDYPIVFKFNRDIKGLLSDPANSGKKIRFYVYYDCAAETATSGTVWNEFYLHTGMGNQLGSGGALASLGNTQGKADLIVANQWREISFTVAELNAKLGALDSTTAQNKYDTLNFGMMVHYISAANYQFDVYVSALELVD